MAFQNSVSLFFIEHVCMSACLPYNVSETDGSRFNSREKHMLKTQFSHIINGLLAFLVRSVLLNIRPLFFALTSLLRRDRSVHSKKPRSDISQYRPHARSITL